MKKNELKDCKIGSIHTLDGVTFIVRCCIKDGVVCEDCIFKEATPCPVLSCCSDCRADMTGVYFKKIEPTLFQKLWTKLTHAYASLLKIIKSWK